MNVEGYIFTTSKHTLSKEPYSLLHYLTKETNETEIFIDRPAKHFETILNFIRNYSTIPLALLPSTKEDLLTLKTEATYYHLPGIE